MNLEVTAAFRWTDCLKTITAASSFLNDKKDLEPHEALNQSGKMFDACLVLKEDETKSIRRKQQSKKVLVSSTKSNTGHLLGAAGGVEAIVCVKAIEEGFVPATINYKVEDPECDLDIVPNEGRNVEEKIRMSRSLTFWRT